MIPKWDSQPQKTPFTKNRTRVYKEFPDGTYRNSTRGEAFPGGVRADNVREKADNVREKADNVQKCPPRVRDRDRDILRDILPGKPDDPPGLFVFETKKPAQRRHVARVNHTLDKGNRQPYMRRGMEALYSMTIIDDIRKRTQCQQKLTRAHDQGGIRPPIPHCRSSRRHCPKKHTGKDNYSQNTCYAKS